MTVDPPTGGEQPGHSQQATKMFTRQRERNLSPHLCPTNLGRNVLEHLEWIPSLSFDWLHVRLSSTNRLFPAQCCPVWGLLMMAG